MCNRESERESTGNEESLLRYFPESAGKFANYGNMFVSCKGVDVAEGEFPVTTLEVYCRISCRLGGGIVGSVCDQGLL